MQKEKPMMTQYNKLKAKNSDCVLLFRLGGFYEMFCKDAYIVSKVLGFKITARNFGNGTQVPMCGIPITSGEKHAKTLSEKGYSVAICDQVEGEKDVGGIIKRKVTKIIRSDDNVSVYCPITEEEYNTYFAEFKEKTKIDAQKKRLKKASKKKEPPPVEVDTNTTIKNELFGLDLDNMTPVAALALLYKWQGRYCNTNDRL